MSGIRTGGRVLGASTGAAGVAALPSAHNKFLVIFGVVSLTIGGLVALSFVVVRIVNKFVR